jgi:hypothetical protein
MQTNFTDNGLSGAGGAVAYCTYMYGVHVHYMMQPPLTAKRG